MVVVCIVLVILATFFFPDMKNLLRRSGEARCMANMRSITISLHGYLQDNQDVWPQGPSPEDEASWEQFWLKVLQPYGIEPKTWKCPTIEASIVSSHAPESRKIKIHYTPTLFDATPGIARRWATHPWLIERGNAHLQGALICFQDGSIKSFNKVLAEMGVR